MKNIKTFEGACKALKLNPKALPVVTDLPEEFQKSTIAAYKLWVIAKALNDGWKPDFANWDERKYYPWFDLSSGFGFSHASYRYTYAYSTVGARLCFKTRELAEYAGKTFTRLYKDMLLMD